MVRVEELDKIYEYGMKLYEKLGNDLEEQTMLCEEWEKKAKQVEEEKERLLRGISSLLNEKK